MSWPAAGAAETRQAWTTYWAQGAAHSCVGSYGDRYGGQLGRFWRERFERIPAGSRVLDIATGNGALPRLLLDHATAPAIECDAIDIADVRPPWLAGLDPATVSRLRFHGGVSASELPFASGQFDLAVSHYGLEYANLDTAVAELLRVLKRGGEVAFVMHHRDGRPASLAKVELAHLRWLLRTDGLFDAAGLLAEPMARAATPEGRAALQDDARATGLRERFNSTLTELSALAGSGAGGDVLHEARDAVMAALAAAGREGDAMARARISSMKEAFHRAGLRLLDLCEHTLDGAAAHALAERLGKVTGRRVAVGEIQDQGHLMGWTIETRR